MGILVENIKKDQENTCLLLANPSDPRTNSKAILVITSFLTLAFGFFCFDRFCKWREVFGLVSLLKGISIFVDHLMQKPFL